MKIVPFLYTNSIIILQCLFYAVNFYVFYGVIIWTHSQKLLQYCHGYWSCNRHLSFQWFGWEVDLGDSQWRSFHDNLLLLSSVAIGLSTLNAIIRSFAPDVPLHWLRLGVGLIILFVQHGLHAFIILILAIFGFLVAQLCSGSIVGPYAVWGYGLFILAFKESYRLLSYPEYRFLQIFFNPKYGGMHAWQYAANFLILRVISYGIDLHNIRQGAQREGKQKKNEDSEENKSSSTITADPGSVQVPGNTIEMYNIMNMLAYVVYAPLYVAGPILSFQDFIIYDSKSQDQESIIKYAFRFVVLFLLMEWCTYRFPVFALVHSGILPHMPVAEIAITFYIILKLMWLKFTTLWRFFRLWALADGVYVEENMLRCMSNNYSLEQFWRGWHASYNKWIVRYIYVPWGGRTYRWVSVWFIFLFVALWHDVEWKLILWGLLNGSFYVMENIVKSTWKAYSRDPSSSKLRIHYVVDHLVSSVAGALYVMVLMVINLVGYALGTGTFHILRQKVFTWDGLVTFAVSLYFLSVGVSLMLTLRHHKICAP